MKTFSPIVIFTYKRLDTLKKTVQSLQKNYLAKESDLYIFSDAPKDNSDKELVDDVRKYLKTISGFHSITIYESKNNKGLATSIIGGVSRILKIHESAIILEDDLVSTNNFLDFMNQSLDKYRDETNIFSISGFSFNLNLKKEYFDDIYFLNRGWSWGWATWRDRWENIDWEITDYNEFIKNKKTQKLFSAGGSDLNSMLKKQMTGSLDSWAIRWFYNQFKIGGLTVYPVKSKILNEGFGVNATHTKGSSRRYIPNLDLDSSTEIHFPIEVKLSEIPQKKFQRKMGLFSRFKSKIETYFGL